MTYLQLRDSMWVVGGTDLAPVSFATIEAASENLEQLGVKDEEIDKALILMHGTGNFDPAYFDENGMLT